MLFNQNEIRYTHERKKNSTSPRALLSKYHQSVIRFSKGSSLRKKYIKDFIDMGWLVVDIHQI